MSQLVNPSDNLDLTNKLVLGYREQWFQVTKNFKYLPYIPLLQLGIKKMHEQGDYNKIVHKYYEDSWLLIEQQ